MSFWGSLLFFDRVHFVTLTIHTFFSFQYSYSLHSWTLLKRGIFVDTPPPEELDFSAVFQRASQVGCFQAAKDWWGRLLGDRWDRFAGWLACWGRHEQRNEKKEGYRETGFFFQKGGGRPCGGGQTRKKGKKTRNRGKRDRERSRRELGGKNRVSWGVFRRRKLEGFLFSGRRRNRGGGSVRSNYFCSREHSGKLTTHFLLYFYHHCFLFLL